LIIGIQQRNNRYLLSLPENFSQINNKKDHQEKSDSLNEEK
jgi:hypothetical protein